MKIKTSSMPEKAKQSHEMVSVMDFGAVGNGLTDDTSSIQSALDFGAAHVVIPSGTFVVSNVVKPGANQCVEINGTLKVCDSVIQTLQQDVAIGDSTVVVEDGSRYRVGQWVTLHDNQLPIHLIDWVTPVLGQLPTHGATYQTRRIHAGNARIVAISGNTLTLDDHSCRTYLRSQNARIGTQHSAVLIEHSNVRICGTGTIDGNKRNQLDAQPGPLGENGGEESRAGCCIKVASSEELTNIIIEGVTVCDAILHNISMGVHNANSQKCVVSDSVIRNVRSINAHDKNIVIGRCRDCSVINNFAGYSEYEDGIVFHQVGDKNSGACRIMVQGNRCVGNPRSGLHVGANQHGIFLANNLCVANGFNITINGDNCSSSGDVAIGYNGRLFPLAKQRPNVLIAGRRLVVNSLTVLESHGVGVGISGEDTIISGGLIENTEPKNTEEDTIGIAISRYSACEESLFPATGLQPSIVPRQAKVFADGVRISGMSIKGFSCAVKVDADIRRIALRDNDLSENERIADIAPEAWSNIQLRDNEGLVSQGNGLAHIPSDQTRIYVTHGLPRQPCASAISVTPAGNPGNASKFWIDNLTVEGFDIFVDNAPGGSGVDFAWRAEVCK